MKRNVAGQKIGAQIITAADGSAFSGAVTVYVTKDAGTQAIGSVGSGVATSEGNGYYTYAPSQSETDGDLLAYTFIGTGAIPVTVQVVPSSEVLDVAYASHATAGTVGNIIGGVLIAANYSQRTVSVTGSNHVAADIHELQPGVITAGDFAAGAIDANAIATDAIGGDELAASAVTKIQSGLATAANQTTILNRLGAFTGSGINTVLGFLRAMANKAASTPSDIGGTYSAATDALEAIRDAQAAGTGDASQATLEAVQDTVDAIAAKVSGGLIEVTSRVATGGNITLYIGDDARVRSGTEIEVTISDVGGTIYSRLNTLGVANLAWGASRRGLSAGAISGTISGLSQSGSGATQALTFVIEVNDAGDDLLPHDDYAWQIVSTSTSGDEWVEVEGTLDLRRRVVVPV